MEQFQEQQPPLSTGDAQAAFRLYAIPVAVVASLVALEIPFLVIFLQFFTMIVHELGHSLFSWLGGQISIPAFFVALTLTDRGNSWISLILCGVFFFFCRMMLQKGRYTTAIVAALLLAITLVFSFFLSSHAHRMLVAFGGFAGAAVFLPLIVALTYSGEIAWFSPLRRKAFLLALGCYAFCDALLLWLKVRLLKEPLPMGSLLFGPDEGDLNTLMSDYGWSEGVIASRYLGAYLCSTVVVLLMYGLFATGPTKTRYGVQPREGTHPADDVS